MSPQVFKSLDAATVIGPGATRFFRKPTSPVSFQISATGAPTSAVVTLEGSLDGVNFSELPGEVGSQSTGGNTALSIPGNGNTPITGSFGVPVIAARANLVILSGGTSPTVTALIAGDD